MKHNEVVENGGSSLLQSIGGLANLLKRVYPHYDWKPWKFDKAAQNSWENESNRRDFFNALVSDFNIKNWRDWYSITKEKIVEYGKSISHLIH